MPGEYLNVRSDSTVMCKKCSSYIERGTMFIEHTFEDGTKEIICHSCYYKMKMNNEL